MGTLYLHIGMPKTGTTTIQYFLAHNRKKLNEEGYAYPDFKKRFDEIGIHRNAHFLVHQCFDEEGNRQMEQERQIKAECWQILLHRLETFANVILSDEGIWYDHELWDDFWPMLRENLEKNGHQLKVLVYLRRQDEFIRSVWTQKVKNSFRLSFQEFVNQEVGESFHLHYEEQLDTIAEAVGVENVIVRAYEKLQFPQMEAGVSLLADFLQAAGLQYSEEYVVDESVRNPGISGEYLEIKRICNKMPEYRGKLNFMIPLMFETDLRNHTASDYGRAAAFLPGQAQLFRQEYEEGNRQVAKKYLQREDGRLFYATVDDDVQPTPYSQQELVLACGRLLLTLQSELEESRQRCSELELELQNVNAARQHMRGRGDMKQKFFSTGQRLRNKIKRVNQKT